MNIHMLKNRGFTLIELLVVIAIIGILASVVLASLNSARQKGSDAAIKSTINNSRAQAELFYDDNGGSYDDVCADTGGIAQFATGATNAGGTNVTCAIDATGAAWALESQLVSTTTFYCVDSSGAAGTQSASTLTDGSDATCG